MAAADAAHSRRAFTLVELLVVIAIVALLASLLAPGLRMARESARTTLCLSQLRQMGVAWTLYASDHDDKAMPLADWDVPHPSGDRVFWFGTDGSSTRRVDHAAGFLTPYLSASLGERSIYECPNQAWGTYRPQTAARSITSTYGYNGYYLTPAKTPGWANHISHRPWQRLDTIQRPDAVLVFADSLLPASPLPRNTALLDPPLLFDRSSGWSANPAPTTAFRHAPRGDSGSACAVHADGGARAYPAQPDWITHKNMRIGSIGKGNVPHYIPDILAW